MLIHAGYACADGRRAGKCLEQAAGDLNTPTCIRRMHEYVRESLNRCVPQNPRLSSNGPLRGADVPGFQYRSERSRPLRSSACLRMPVGPRA